MESRVPYSTEGKKGEREECIEENVIVLLDSKERRMSYTPGQAKENNDTGTIIRFCPSHKALHTTSPYDFILLATLPPAAAILWGGLFGSFSSTLSNAGLSLPLGGGLPNG